MDLANELALVVNEAGTVDEALESVLERLCRETGWVLGLGWTLTPDGHHLECRAAYRDGSFEPRAFLDTSRTLQFAPGQGLAGRVWSPTPRRTPSSPRTMPIASRI